MWSVLAHLHPIPHGNHTSRVTQYTSYEYTELLMNGLVYPITLSQIPKFEKQNPSLSINVFGFDDIVFPLHITDKCERNHVNLLLMANRDGDQHYCLIRNLIRLLGKRTHHNGQSYYCNYCLHAFTKQSLLDDHTPYCQPHGLQRIKVVDEQNK